MSSTNLHSQAARARELTFLDKVILPHLSIVVKLVGGGSVINGAYCV
jgi:hypothetical protein